MRSGYLVALPQTQPDMAFKRTITSSWRLDSGVGPAWTGTLI